MENDSSILGFFVILCFAITVSCIITGIKVDIDHTDSLCGVIAPITQDYFDCKNKDFNYVLKFTKGEYKKVSTNEQQ